MMQRGTKFDGLGYAAPERVVSNREIEQQLGLESGWIERRTGIKERRWAGEGDTLTDLAATAGRMALTNSAQSPASIGLVILATSTPDHLLPPSAPRLAQKLGLTGAGAIDLAGACTGFLYALSFADAFARQHGTSVLIVAANILSRRINPEERTTSILFADSAGAVIITPSDDTTSGLRGVSLSSDGDVYDSIKIDAGGSQNPFSTETLIEDTHMVMSDGKAVFAQAISMMTDTAGKALQAADIKASHINHFIPHQANARIMSGAEKSIGIGSRRMWSTVESFGNASAATIPFTLAKRYNAQNPEPGQHVLMTAAGAGMIAGSIVWKL